MTNEQSTTAQSAVNPELELEMQELEAMEAPGFWTGVSVGVAISASVATSVAIT
ncbi:daptide-type RiPP [Nocardiopsis metallicus]|uniref:Uncharacterized protein n=1 Tax=Nocardiopsis metallicus TaxID=179819 RepID=A0A840WBL5_9ACTN|nr:daptide-type RiPP [Nocardiopsis metallicus]MBB5493531.1 hypothetical protein [Nocardiopsis metallicus]MBB5493532.1 hypothetical protein [Nocardiopsis metallicus]